MSKDERSAECHSPPASVNQTRRDWPTGAIASVGATSFLSDAGHEIATAILPSFVTTVLHSTAAALGLIEGVSDALTGIARLVAAERHQRRDRDCGACPQATFGAFPDGRGLTRPRRPRSSAAYGCHAAGGCVAHRRSHVPSANSGRPVGTKSSIPIHGCVQAPGSL